MGNAIPARTLKNVSWYFDDKAISKGEPGICHSYMSSLATVLNYIEGQLDPVWLIGSSAFAFRIFINEVMCPSALSIFDWSSILPEAVEQAGYHCNYVSRMWREGDKEKEKRQEAHVVIVEGIDRGFPAVVWDIADCNWGLIIGYDQNRQLYETLPYQGKPSSLPFEKLGQNGNNILSVAVPGEPNTRSREEIILNSLKAAVAHADQKEWMDRPKYQNGLPAYDLWALLFDRWASIIKAGKDNKINPNIPDYSLCYAGHHYSARCYARDYLKMISCDNIMLQKASLSYERVASFLKPVWDCFFNRKELAGEVLLSLAASIKSARAAEEEGINYIKEYIT